MDLKKKYILTVPAIWSDAAKAKLGRVCLSHRTLHDVIFSKTLFRLHAELGYHRRI